MYVYRKKKVKLCFMSCIRAGIELGFSCFRKPTMTNANPTNSYHLPKALITNIELTKVSLKYCKSFSELSSGNPVDIIIENSDKIRWPCFLKILNA